MTWHSFDVFEQKKNIYTENPVFAGIAAEQLNSIFILLSHDHFDFDFSAFVQFGVAKRRLQRWLLIKIAHRKKKLYTFLYTE